jgi:hypothetical protein
MDQNLRMCGNDRITNLGWRILEPTRCCSGSRDWVWRALICHITGFARLFLM